jgi:hypothetical protein
MATKPKQPKPDKAFAQAIKALANTPPITNAEIIVKRKRKS